MLCEECQNTLQASVIRWRTLPRDRVTSLADIYEHDCLSPSPLHFSLSSFYRSITAGCYACRQLWATILEQSNASKEGRGTSKAPFLSDSTQAIPHCLDDFRREFAKHMSIATSWLPRLLQENVVTKTILLTIPWAIRSMILRCILYVGEAHVCESKWVLAPIRFRCKQRSRIWLRIDLFGHFFELCAGNTYTRLDLPKACPRTCNDAASTAGAISEAQHASTASTAETANLWRHWFTTCLTTHSDCRVIEHSLRPFVPKRLIQILQDDHGESSLWRLVCHPVNDAIQYLTLSHCWGSYQPIYLDNKTIHEFTNPTSVSKLPKTYQHALTVTHELGFQYIWIDSLCILQDEKNKQDWEEQSKLMGSIYSHAVCNIAATWASDGRDGCFSTNDPFSREPTRITLSPDLDWWSESTSSQQYHLWQEDSYHEDILAAPLNQRGWVVQERYLSRRQLNFAKRQIYWECHELMASEQFPTGIVNFERGIKTFTRHVYNLSKPCLHSSEIRQSWADLVNLYSRCQLTKESDKLVAISGLAREVGSILKDTCIQGLWKKDFYQQLCWKAILVEGAGSTTTGCRNIPTWSWAHINGPVDTARAYGDKGAKGVPWVEVVEWPDPDDPTSRLALRGIVLPHISVKISPEFHNSLTLYFRDGFNPHSTLFQWMKISVDWDEQTASGPLIQQGLSNAEFGIRLSSDFRFLMILSHTSGKRYYRGIVLLPRSAGEREEYVRVGTFNTWVANGRNMITLRNHLGARLGCQPSEIEDHLDLNDPRLADLIETVHIV
ncbi:heterokaryon incompatibility protein-domain-containing protein [Xylaria cf. heliscus]|nr:heterokaryon incompatibility protein-domain-containing protein [Xylaria cf. heliscus]